MGKKLGKQPRASRKQPRASLLVRSFAIIMADDAFGGVEKIVKVALAIKEAVETVKQNDKECRAIEKCAARCSALLKRLEEQTDTMNDEAMRGPLEDVAEGLEEALELVKLCQRTRKHNKISQWWNAADMAKELGRVQDDILRKVQMGHFATPRSRPPLW
ncbi:hypothetical protein EJB05_54366, partial [Eragrostis curvula]